MEKVLIDDPRLTPTMERVRNGSVNMFREKDPNNRNFIRKDNADVILEHPTNKEMYAELIDGVWYWVSGCKKCTGEKGQTYILCDKHNCCSRCGVNRKEIKEPSVWGRADGGWECCACHDIRMQERKDAAFEKLNGEEPDCDYTDNVVCPHCGTEIIDSEIYDDYDDYECHVCGGIMDIEVHRSISYSTVVKGERVKP